MPADKRKMWLGDGVQFYEPIEELGGTFESRLGQFRIFSSNSRKATVIIRAPFLAELFWNDKRSNNQFQRAR